MKKRKKESSLSQQGKKGKLSVFTLLFMTAALFMTLRNMPSMAETGLQMIFFNIITVVAFLIPVALVSAELATGWPQNGVFHWVEAAFGTKFGFFAVWLQWAQSIFGITSILAYVGGTLAYAFNPQLGNNNYFITFSILVIYWLATLMNFKGTKRSGQISSIALVLGVLLPTIFLIIAGVFYALKGNPIHLSTSLSENNLIPTLANTTGLVLFLNFVFGFVGIEVSATHANEVENPQKNYPLALFSAAVIGFLFTLLGAFSIAFIIPLEEINSINGAIQAFSKLFTQYKITWLIPIIASLIALGAAGQVSTWIVGPIKGLWAAGKQGNLPPYFHKQNQAGVPVRMLIAQAIFISAIGLLFLLTNNVNSMFQILTAIAIILYCIMYILMFVGAIKLRYTQPNVPRAYKIPGGKLGIWIISGIGTLCVIACLFIGFIPPQPIPVSNNTIYFILIFSAVTLFITIPLILYKIKKKNWKTHKN